MALTNAVTLNFDGTEPYATDGTADSDGAYHLPKIKRGSTTPWTLTFPSLTAAGETVADYFWVAHFRTLATDADAEIIVRYFYSGHSFTEASSIVANPSNPSTSILITLDADEVASMGVGSGVWDLEAWKWTTANTPSAGYDSKDRIVSGTFEVTQDVTRESDSTGTAGV